MSATSVAFPPSDGVVTVEGLSKRFNAVKAVDDLTFTVAPGRVTGFLARHDRRGPV